MDEHDMTSTMMRKAISGSMEAEDDLWMRMT
jgi:hypothetical protein